MLSCIELAANTNSNRIGIITISSDGISGKINVEQKEEKKRMFITIIIQFVSVIASFGVIAMTYHVYKLNQKSTQIDSYLKQIISLYYKIEDDSKLLKVYNKLDESQIAQCYRRIEINATLMRYYISMFPEQYEGKETFIQVIGSISHSPEEQDDYDKLSDEFKKFCKNIEK